MANPAFETVESPFTTFRFEVVLNVDTPTDGVSNPVCDAAFAECEGLEMTMEPKTVQAGGANDRQVHLLGPTRYGQITLRRGMTANLQLWAWMAAATGAGRISTAQGEITMWDADGTPRVTFVLEDCLPVKLRAPGLNAKDGLVAIEELGLVCARFSVRPADAAGVGVSAGIGVSAGASISVSGGAGLSVSASASLDVGFG